MNEREVAISCSSQEEERQVITLIYTYMVAVNIDGPESISAFVEENSPIGRLRVSERTEHVTTLLRAAQEWW